MKKQPDMEKIARALSAERRGSVSVSGGYFGAVQLAAEVATRLCVPKGGGRRTNPTWEERRLVPFSKETLQRLEELAKQIRRSTNLHVEPMQLAAMLLEKAAQEIEWEELEEIAQS